MLLLQRFSKLIIETPGQDTGLAWSAMLLRKIDCFILWIMVTTGRSLTFDEFAPNCADLALTSEISTLDCTLDD